VLEYSGTIIEMCQNIATGEEIMPFIRILGMPTDTKQVRLEMLTKAIQNAVSRVNVLDIPADAVYVFYPPDLQQKGLGEELIAMIEGLYIKEARTDDVLTDLRNSVCDCLAVFARACLPQCTNTEAFIASLVKQEDCSVRNPTEPWDRCPDCRGRGGSGSDEPCGTCKGTGKVATEAS
jgi:hypothetical protein